LFAAPNGDVFGFSGPVPYTRGIIYRPFKGNQWYSANSGLQYMDHLSSMAFAPDGTAYLATRDQGVWRSQGNVNAVNTSAIDIFSLEISPNPASDKIEISYSLAQAGY